LDATDLFDDAALSPQQRAVVIAAFEAAWAWCAPLNRYQVEWANPAISNLD
jgi:hypothetical protein